MIPRRLIFVWFGDDLPFTALLALRSAVRVCKPEETLIVHEGLRSGAPGVARALAEPGVRLVDAAPLFDGLPELGELARTLYRELAKPAARANLARLAALWHFGGVYLDTDTITLRDFSDLEQHAGYCGLEILVRPGSSLVAASAAQRALQLARGWARAACSAAPRGDRAFRVIDGVLRFPRAVNNAVLAASPKNPLIAEAFAAIARMDDASRHASYRLGTHLLQQVTGNVSRPEMTVLPPDYFYPLGPELSRHWFSRGTAQRLSELLTERTHVVHWYSSLEAKLAAGPLNEDYVRRHHEDTAFARLALAYIG